MSTLFTVTSNDAASMISYVAKVIHLFATTLQNVILIASLTGEIIISATIWICSTINNMLITIMNFFYIVYEDNLCMFTEVPNSAQALIDSTLEQFLFIRNGVENSINFINYKVSAIIGSIVWLFTAVYMIVSEVLTLLLNTVLLMGETTWLLITFIPVHMPQLMRSGAKFMTNIAINAIVDGYMRLLKFTNYLTEVPLESFLGITSAIIIVRLCVHFKESIVNFLQILYVSSVRNLLYLYHVCYNYFTHPEVQVITRITGEDIISARDIPFEDDNNDDANAAADAMCVICQERQKSVLTLPCRHICLCTECCRRLYSYQRTCPICRTFIYHSVTVYL